MTKGFRKKTDEDLASEELYDFFYNSPGVKVHCWHPPDGKAYFTLLLQLPQIDRNGERTGKRDHIDLVVQIKNSLLLLEVKGKLSDSGIDYDKLKRISQIFDINEIVDLFEQQGAKFSQKPTELVLGIGARKLDADCPPQFALFQAGDSEVKWHGNVACNLMELVGKL